MTATASISLLLVTADESLAAGVETALDDRVDSYTLEVERTESDVLEAVRSGDIDCLVSEYDLPESDGLALLRAVREMDSDLPYVLFPAEGDESVAGAATEHGVSRYVPRNGPQSTERLIENVIEAVGERSTLEQQVSLYENILESLDDAVYAIKPDGTIVYINERYAQMKGVDREELLGTDIYQWVSEETAQKGTRAREEIARGERDVGVVEYDFLTADGDSFPAELRFTTAAADDEMFDRAGVIRDVSDRVAREQSLRETNERLEEFTSIVSHDLRNPLDVAQTRLELAQRETDSEHLDEIGEALDRMERLLEELLALAQQGETIDDPTPVSVRHLATTAWAAVETSGGRLDVEISGMILADGSRLAQLFENLYRNAIEHAGPAVTVSVGDLSDEDGFYVADDGPGIPPEGRETVFDSGYTTAPNGTGFGLAIVEEIVDAHGWDIRVTDSDSGGARFEIFGVDVVSE